MTNAFAVHNRFFPDARQTETADGENYKFQILFTLERLALVSSALDCLIHLNHLFTHTGFHRVRRTHSKSVGDQSTASAPKAQDFSLVSLFPERTHP